MAATPFLQPPWQTPYRVSSVLLVGPTEEPLTLDEAKLRAGLSWAPGDPRDALMTSFIKSARAKVEQDTGLALLQQTRRISISAVGGLPMPIPMQATPLQSITDESTGAPVPLPPAFFANPGAWTFPSDYTGTWQIVAGWPTPAALAAEAPLLLHAVGLLCAHMATLGRDLAQSEHGSYPTVYGYDDAVSPHRQLWIV